MSISIAGINKIKLLQALVQRTAFIGFNAQMGYHGPSFDEAKAREAVKRRIDYYCGKPIKCDLSGDEVDPWLYDRDAGQGAFARCVESVSSMTPGISIASVDKVKLLKALVEATPFIGYNAQMGYHGPSFDEGKAREDVKHPIDYYCGKPIKCDLSGDYVDPSSYDLDAGQGTFARCLVSIRNM